ncbi:MAG: 1,3-beta-D-glucan synthase [Chaenotheca gracillima]|nr:MAG: 1,3-beta-D-glucan synthase [Chaenotheca gracillima]
MPMTLLPASAAAFAPRSAPTVVLNSKVEPWLTATLKRTNRVKRPLNSAPQHKRCLTETLSSSTAIWTLCSLMLPKAPDAELRKDDNPLVEALFNYQLIHMEAYVVHVDLVYQNEVAFKLNPESIELLVEYHKDIYSVDCAAKTWDWSEKESQVKKLHDEFVQAANKFVFRANALALEGLEEDGAGELLCGRSEEVKNAIMALFVPLLPPPPRVVETPPQMQLLPSSPGPSLWWSQPALPPSHPAPIDSWKVVPSSPSATSSDSNSSLWANMGMTESQLSSPTPSYSQPFSSASQYYAAAQTMAPLPQLPLPSTLAMPCGPSAGFGGFGGFGGMGTYGGGFTGFGGFGWDRYQEYTTTI